MVCLGRGIAETGDYKNSWKLQVSALGTPHPGGSALASVSSRHPVWWAQG